MNVYDIGDQVRLAVTFAVGGVAVDPTAITFAIVKPDGTTTTYVYGVDAALVRTAIGGYRVDWTVAADGVHVYRWAATGAAIAAEEGIFTVRQSWVLP